MGKIMKYVKDHKKRLAVVVGMATIGGVVFAVTRNMNVVRSIHMSNDLPIPDIMSNDLPIPDIGSGKIKELWMEKNGVVDAIVNDIPIADLGRFGEELVKNVEQITPGMTVDAIMGFGKQDTTA